MTQDEVRKYLGEALSFLEQRELENIVAYYLDARRREILSCSLELPKLEADATALKEGQPVQYVTGISFFYGHQFDVRSGCLIPRPETEELVHWIVSDCNSLEGVKLLDIGTGSGCILISALVALEKKGIDNEGYGLDISEAAIDIFKGNAQKLSIGAHAIVGNILGSIDLPSELDVIVSNPPYILNTEKGRMDTSVLEYEPEVALFVDGPDPLLFYKRIMHLGYSLLKPGGSIYFETSDLYHAELEAAIDSQKYSSEFRQDMSGKWRMLKLTKRQLS